MATGRICGDRAHMRHMDHAERTRQLTAHLRAALLLSRANQYPSALVVIRSALEHHLMDRLVFLANRDLRIIPKVKKVDVPDSMASDSSARRSTLL